MMYKPSTVHEKNYIDTYYSTQCCNSQKYARGREPTFEREDLQRFYGRGNIHDRLQRIVIDGKQGACLPDGRDEEK